MKTQKKESRERIMGHYTDTLPARQLTVPKRGIPDPREKKPLSTRRRRIRIQRETCQWSGCQKKVVRAFWDSRLCWEHGQGTIAQLLGR